MALLPYPLDLPADRPFDIALWHPHHYIAFVVVVQLGLVVLELICSLPGLLHVKQIPPSGKPLMTLEFKDWAFIIFNRLSIVLFAQQAANWAWNDPRVHLELAKADFWNTVVAFPLLYIIYDFFYTLWHRFLHVRAIYPYIHKHHHRQVVPFRGNLDAVNVHPIEFVTGDYCHLLAAWLAVLVLPTGLHALTFLVFVGLGGILATLNHTRYDLGVGDIFEVAYHDG